MTLVPAPQPGAWKRHRSQHPVWSAGDDHRGPEKVHLHGHQRQSAPARRWFGPRSLPTLGPHPLEILQARERVSHPQRSPKSRGTAPQRLTKFSVQFTENGWDLFEFRGFIEKEICASAQALLAVLRIRVVRANQKREAGVVWDESHGVLRDQSLPAFGSRESRLWLICWMQRIASVASLACPASSTPGISFKRSARRSTITARVVRDKDSHFLPPQGSSTHP